MRVVEKDGISRYFIEFGNRAVVEVVPGLDHGSRFLGTFDREEAVINDELEFFANGHPLVEGLIAEIEDSDDGRIGIRGVPSQHPPTTPAYSSPSPHRPAPYSDGPQPRKR